MASTPASVNATQDKVIPLEEDLGSTLDRLIEVHDEDISSEDRLDDGIGGRPTKAEPVHVDNLSGEDSKLELEHQFYVCIAM